MNGVGDALVDVLLRAFEDGRPRLRALADWISEASRPPRGVRLVADDGAAYTGLVIVEQNEPRLMLAVCVGSPRPRAAHVAPYPGSFDDRLAPYVGDPFSRT